jgi:hypothetical protein
MCYFGGVEMESGALLLLLEDLTLNLRKDVAQLLQQRYG